jgi:hypothetical protein
MAHIVRTAKGTNTKTAAGTTLSLTSVQLDEGACCVVGIAYRAPLQRTVTVTWGARTLKEHGSVYGGNIGCDVHIIPDVKTLGGDTRDIDVTWSASCTDAAIFVSQFTNVRKIDETSQKTEASTSAPDSGATAATHYTPELAVGVFAGGGGTSGATGTPDASFTLGQRDGTDTGTTDITLVETYKELDTTGAVTAGLTGADTQRWSTCVIALHEVLKDRALIHCPAEWFDKLVVGQVTDGVNAWLLLTHARFNYEFLPATPSDDTLTELGLTLTEYQNARTRLSTEGIVTLESDGTIG